MSFITLTILMLVWQNYMLPTIWHLMSNIRFALANTGYQSFRPYCVICSSHHTPDLCSSVTDSHYTLFMFLYDGFPLHVIYVPVWRIPITHYLCSSVTDSHYTLFMFLCDGFPLHVIYGPLVTDSHYTLFMFLCDGFPLHVIYVPLWRIPITRYWQSREI